MRPRCVVVAAAAIAMVLALRPIRARATPAAGGQDVAPTPTFHATTDAVAVDVSVRVGTRVITGLKAADFTVLDNGVRQQIVDVSYAKLPIDVTVAFDVSGSVTGALLDGLRRATVQLMHDLGKTDRLRLLLFGLPVRRVVDFTTDVAAVERAIQSAVSMGGTSLYDAMSVALISATPRDRRQLIMFFTDGGENFSVTDDAALLDVARRTRATVTLVMPMAGPGTAVTALLPRQHLISLVASETGGSTLFTTMQPPTFGLTAGLTTVLTEVFRNALEVFRSSYVVYYVPQGVDRAGVHTLKVSVPTRGATVQARRGYVGG